MNSDLNALNEPQSANDVLEAFPDSSFDRILQLATYLFSAPISVLTLTHHGQHTFQAQRGLPSSRTDADFSFLIRLIVQQGTTIIGDTWADARFKDHPQITAEKPIRFFAVTPLRERNGEVIGSLCVMDCVSHEPPARSLFDNLEALAGLAVEQIICRSAPGISQALSASRYTSQSLFENASMGILAVNNEGRIVDANGLLLKLLGYQLGELIGASVETLLPDALRHAHLQHRADYVAHPRVRHMGLGLDLLARRKDGSTVPVEISLSYSQGITMAFVSDISARKLASQERELLIMKLQGALAEKIVLIKEVHHRVKNNLAVVSGLLALQAESIGDERLTTALEESQRRVSSMALVHEYLYSSERLDRINIGSYLRKLVNELATTYQGYGSHAHVILALDDIELAVDQAIPCGLIVNELVSNAFKHAFPDARSGEIKLTLRALEKGEVLLSCRDNGVGVSENRVRRTPPSLGLEIVRMLAGQIEGEFIHDLKQVIGAGFEVRFPRGKPFDVAASA